MTETDRGFCPKLNPWTTGDMRLDEEDAKDWFGSPKNPVLV